MKDTEMLTKLRLKYAAQLTGSRAWGVNTLDSDIDFIITTARATEFFETERPQAVSPPAGFSTGSIPGSVRFLHSAINLIILDPRNFEAWSWATCIMETLPKEQLKVKRIRVAVFESLCACHKLVQA